MVEDRRRVAETAEIAGQHGPGTFRHEEVGEPAFDRLGSVHPVTGQAEIFPKPPRSPRQKITAPDIGDQPDAAFRHGDPAGLADDAELGMAGDPDPTAHHETLGQHDHRLWPERDPGIQAIFLGPEGAAIGEVAAPAGLVDLGDIAAGAEGALALGVDEQQRHLGRIAPGNERGVDRGDHRAAERVQRLGAGQRDPPGSAFDPDMQVAHASSACRYSIVGIEKAAPSLMPDGQRAVTVLVRV